DVVGAGGQRLVAGVEGGAGGADVVDEERDDVDALAVGQRGGELDVGGADARRRRDGRGDRRRAARRELGAHRADELVVGGDAGVRGGGGAVLVLAEDRDDLED